MPTEDSTDTKGRTSPAPRSVHIPADKVNSAAAPGIWGRIREHKVVQWTLVYAAAAYTLLHIVEMVGEAFDWPHAVARVVTLGLILGVPVAATLAWYHGYRALHRVSGPELAILTVLLFIAGSVLWALSPKRHVSSSPQTMASNAAGKAALPLSAS